MTHLWTCFSFILSTKWGGTWPGPWWPLLRQLQMGMKVGVRELGLGKGWWWWWGWVWKEMEVGCPIGPLYPRFIINHSCWAPSDLPAAPYHPCLPPIRPSPQGGGNPSPPTPHPWSTPPVALAPPQNGNSCYPVPQESCPSLSPHLFLFLYIPPTPFFAFPLSHSLPMSPTTTLSLSFSFSPSHFVTNEF